MLNPDGTFGDNAGAAALKTPANGTAAADQTQNGARSKDQLATATRSRTTYRSVYEKQTKKVENMLNSLVSTEECEVQIDEEFKKLEINWSNFKKSCLATTNLRPPADQVSQTEQEELAAMEKENNKLITRRRQRLDRYELRVFTKPKNEADIGKLHVIPEDGDFPTFGLSPPMHSPVDEEKQRLYEDKARADQRAAEAEVKKAEAEKAREKQKNVDAEAEIARNPSSI